MISALYYAGLLVGIIIIWLLIRQILVSVKRLDYRIDEYREEGPPADPFTELAKLMAEDEASRPSAWFNRNKTKGSD